MASGYYVLLHRRSGAQLAPHFFTPNVLDRYRDDPNYVVTERRVSTRDSAPNDVESSMIQQYVWGTSADGSPCVVVLEAHLCMLSGKDQDYWRLHELAPQDARQARIDERYRRPMLEGEFPDTISAYDAIFLYAREIQKLFAPEALFPNMGDRPFDFLAPIPYNSRKAMAEFAQHLYSMLSV